MNKVTIVIPCFNEEESLPKIIEKIIPYTNSINFLIIDNGSTDNSKTYLTKIEDKLNRNIKLLFIDKNEGYGSGVYEGLTSIKNSEYIGWIHGDLQFDFQSLNSLINFLDEYHPSEGHLFYKGKRYGRGIIDTLFSFMMGKIATLILKRKFEEINAQPTIFSIELMDYMKNPPKDFRFDTYVYWLAMINNYVIAREKYAFPKRVYGSSKWNVNLFSKINYSINLIKYFFELRKKN